MIYSLEIEKQVLAAFIQKPKVLVNFIHLIGESDFYDGSLLHRTLFSVLKRACEQDESIDEIVLVQRIKDLGIKFEEDISLVDYVRSLSMRKVHSDLKIKSSIKENVSSVGLRISSCIPQILLTSTFSLLVPNSG